MDDHYNNIVPEDAANMNGHHDQMENADQNGVFSRLFALDQQPDPSPRFVAQLGRSLMPSAGKMTLLSATTSVHGATSESQPLTEASGGGKRRRPIISFGSAAVLMVIVVLVGYAVTLWAVESSNDPPAYMAFGSTFEASSTATSEGCSIQPLELTYVTRLISHSVNGIPENTVIESPNGTPDMKTGTAPAPGTPASEDVVQRISAVYDQYTVCLNNRDYLRAYALFTDSGIARMLAPNGAVNTYGLSQLGASPLPGYSGRQFDEFERVEELPDGRVVGYPFGEEIPENYVIFKQVDGHWKIDDLFESHG
ncbi:hypothetical protein BH09CHL1_BH09CHL1_19890 [soil metagenome]